MITRIEKESTYEKRYRIYVDDRPLFSIHEDILVKFHIHKGMPIDPVQLENLFAEEEKNRVRHAAYHYLSYKPRTTHQVRQHLLQKIDCKEYIEPILSELVEKGYLNDQQYAIEWVRDKRKLKGWGRFRLKQELEKKGIGANWIDEALDENMDNEYPVALEKAQKRYARFYQEPWIKVERKLGSYLLREGFSHDITYKILNDLRLTHRESE